jgi:TfoX/Sxy family transcriptional regulator of competence genes
VSRNPLATTQHTIDFLLEQMAGAGDVSARAMFGEYGVYCDGRIVALVCNNQLYVKPTSGGRAFIGTVTEAPPYQGAKPSLLIDNEHWDDADWLAQLIAVTCAELPLPKPKKPKKPK